MGGILRLKTKPVSICFYAVSLPGPPKMGCSLPPHNLAMKGWKGQTHSHLIRSRLQAVYDVCPVSLAVAPDLFVAQIPQDRAARTGQDEL